MVAEAGCSAWRGEQSLSRSHGPPMPAYQTARRAALHCLQWFYENKPLQYTKMVNGPSYKRWKLPLPVMSTLYRLAGQVRPAAAGQPSAGQLTLAAMVLVWLALPAQLSACCCLVAAHCGAAHCRAVQSPGQPCRHTLTPRCPHPPTRSPWLPTPPLLTAAAVGPGGPQLLLPL